MAKLSRKRAETVATWAIGVHLLLGLACVLIGSWVKAETARLLHSLQLVSWWFFAGIPVWLLCWVHVRQKRLAEEEQSDWERLLSERERQGGRGALFEVEEGEAFLMRNRLKAMERFWLPASSLLVVVVLGLLCFLLVRAGVLAQTAHRVEAGLRADRLLYAAALVTVEAIIAFLLGMFAAGMAKEEVWRDIRAGASYLMFGAACLGLAIISLVTANFGFHIVEVVVCWAVLAAFALIAFETLLNFTINCYRPRVAGIEVRHGFDSRLLELVTSPGSVLQTAAATLDYQFGFKVSETWFYRFMERMIAPIILFDLLTLYALSCFVIVDASEVGVVERFGRPMTSAGVLRVIEPGIHVKYPWPVEKVYRVPAGRVRTLSLGYTKEKPGATAFLWTEEHYEKEYHFLIATDVTAAEAAASEDRPPPVNLLAAPIAVHYRVKAAPAEEGNLTYRPSPEALRQYIYRFADADRFLEAVAYREATKYLAGVDFYAAMCTSRRDIGEALRARIQAAADAEGLGVEVLFVGITGAHPPVTEGVGQAFEEVVAARQEKEALVLAAQGYEIEQTRMAEYEARALLAQARAYQVERHLLAKAEAERFAEQVRLYRMAPRVYLLRAYLEELQQTLADLRKYVVLARGWAAEVVELNLEEARRTGLLDVGKIGEESGSAGGGR